MWACKKCGSGGLDSTPDVCPRCGHKLEVLAMPTESVRHEARAQDDEKVWRCADCGSERVRRLQWVDMNTLRRYSGPDDSPYPNAEWHCPDCDSCDEPKHGPRGRLAKVTIHITARVRSGDLRAAVGRVLDAGVLQAAIEEDTDSTCRVTECTAFSQAPREALADHVHPTHE